MMKAVLSTTVLPVDGIYSVKTLRGEERDAALAALVGVPHYIGHPDTKTLAEALGCVPAPTKLFAGLEPGESCLCLPIKQGLSSRATEGYTVHQAVADLGTLDVRVLMRLMRV